LVLQGGEVSVEQMTSLHGHELFLFSAIARPGNSGGPILSESGHAVGIVTQELSEQDSRDQPFHAGIATATLAQAIRELDCGVCLPVETW
jgi:S1-C subfamily serine protease